MLSEFSVLLGVHLLSAGMLIALLALVLLGRQERLALWLGAAFTALLLWNIAYILELAASGLDDKLIWANVQFIGATLLPVFWLQAMFVATRARPLPRGLAVFIYGAAAAILACIYLDPGHLFRGQPGLDAASAVVFVDADYGLAYYFLWMPFAWGLLIATLAVLVRGCLHWDQLIKARSRLLLVATLIPMVCGALFISGVLPWPNFNPTVASLSIGSLFCALALLRYRPELIAKTWLFAAIIALSLGQITWALNYWRIGALTAGLLLLLIFYVLVGLAQQQLLGKLSRRALWEFGSVAVAALLIIFNFT